MGSIWHGKFKKGDRLFNNFLMCSWLGKGIREIRENLQTHRLNYAAADESSSLLGTRNLK